MTSPPLPLHVGYSGTRFGMSSAQRRAVARHLADIADIHRVPIVAHHGCCIGGDEEFHDLASDRSWHTHGHPGQDWPSGPLCARITCDVMENPQPRMRRNALIVAVSHVMIAAPLENEPQVRGGTWATIRMALRALRAGTLRELNVVGRDGALLDHARWT